MYIQGFEKIEGLLSCQRKVSFGLIGVVSVYSWPNSCPGWAQVEVIDLSSEGEALGCDYIRLDRVGLIQGGTKPIPNRTIHPQV